MRALYAVGKGTLNIKLNPFASSHPINMVQEKYFANSFKFDFGWLIWLFTSQSTIFQLCRDGSSWVEPVLGKD